MYDAILGKKNRIYYITKFEQFDQQAPGMKASWNWPAFLCGGVWALYRKMYGWFFAFWGIAVLSNIFEKAGSPGLGALVFLAPWVAFTIFANSLYHGSVKKKIAVAQLTIKDESKLLEYLRYKGGVHTWVIWIFGLLPIIGILAAILIPISSLLKHPVSVHRSANTRHLLNNRNLLQSQATTPMAGLRRVQVAPKLGLG